MKSKYLPLQISPQISFFKEFVRYSSEGVEGESEGLVAAAQPVTAG